MSVIEFIHYVIPTVEKKNSKKQCKLKSPENVLRKFFLVFLMLQQEISEVSLFFLSFVPKKSCPPFFLVVGVVHPDWASFAAAKRCIGSTVRDSEGLDG